MDSKNFVQITKQVVMESAIKDTIDNLVEPLGKKPKAELKEMSDYYKNCTNNERQIIANIIRESAEATFFGFLCVIDGVRAIEGNGDKGSLELWYRKGEFTRLINDENEDFLHDLI